MGGTDPDAGEAPDGARDPAGRPGYPPSAARYDLDPVLEVVDVDVDEPLSPSHLFKVDELAVQAAPAAARPVAGIDPAVSWAGWSAAAGLPGLPRPARGAAAAVELGVVAGLHPRVAEDLIGPLDGTEGKVSSPALGG